MSLPDSLQRIVDSIHVGTDGKVDYNCAGTGDPEAGAVALAILRIFPRYRNEQATEQTMRQFRAEVRDHLLTGVLPESRSVAMTMCVVPGEKTGPNHDDYATLKALLQELRELTVLYRQAMLHGPKSFEGGFQKKSETHELRAAALERLLHRSFPNLHP